MARSTGSEPEQETFLKVFGEAGRALGNATVAFHQAVADQLGLHITDHKALGLLLEKGTLPAGELGDALSLSSGSTTALIDRLERAGYVTRERDPDDRRRVMVSPTRDPEILEPLQSLFDPMARHFAEEMPDYDPAEQRLLLEFVERAVRALHGAAAEVRRRGGESAEPFRETAQ